MKKTVKERDLCVFIEGTTTADHTLIRPRPGAFLVGERIQPVVLHYHSPFPQAWLCESIVRHVFNLARTPFSYCVVEYLPVIEKETPDECGKRIADALGATYLPYSNADYWWFSGNTSDKSRCTPEYINDFGWMGQI